MARQNKDKIRQLRILSQSAMLEEARTPSLIRATMLIICLSFIVFVGWSAVTKIKERARTTGQIVPSTYVQSVQHLRGGVIEAILVRDDDQVRKGQVLIRLRGDDIRSDHARVRTKLVLLDLQAARIRSFLSGDRKPFDRLCESHPDLCDAQQEILAGMLESLQREKDVLRQQLEQKQDQLRLLEKELATAEKELAIARTAYTTQDRLFRERLVSETTYLAVVRQLAEQEGEVDSLKIRISQAGQSIDEYRQRLQAMEAGARDKALQRLDDILGERAETAELEKKLQRQIDELAIRAPVDGVVKGLEVHTIGGVIAPGKQLMEIVPADSELLAEVKISPNDIGHIRVGFPVIIKVTSYDFSRYGALNGTVTGLSATTFTSSRGITYYKGMIRLEKNYMGNTPGKNILLPGMIVNADIITGEKSLLAYFLKPIHKALNSAFSER